jgi:hypothetical protein
MRASTVWIGLAGGLALAGCEGSGVLGGDDDDSRAPADDDDTTTDDDGPLVNEIVSDNSGSVLDDTGQISDWIELFNPTAGTVALDGWTVSDDWTVPALHTLPDGLLLPPGGHMVLWADGSPEPTGTHLPFRLAAAGEAVGLFRPGGEVADWVEFPSLGEDEAYARLPDGSDSWAVVGRGTPGAPNADLQATTVPVVAPGAVWRYRDDGVDPGPGWTTAAFDDGAWRQGPAPLGYGDPVSTEVGYGPNPSDKHATTWFRRTVSIPPDLPGAASALRVSLRADDGGVVWLNGQELGRVRMPAGEVTAATWASSTLGGADETEFVVWTVGPEALATGPNQLAVEIHQADPQSSDIVFDLGLEVTVWSGSLP